jgi:CRISPR type III-B/RAMP module-associated protein Cmr3
MTYLFELTPHERFFFGGPEAFGDDNHYVVSERFAQNSQLLGALRRWLLESYGLLKARKNGIYVHAPKNNAHSDGKTAQALVGRAAINDEPTQENGGLGIIERISPLFIISDDDALFPLPFDVAGKKDDNNPEKSYLRIIKTQRRYGRLLPTDYNVKEGNFCGLGGKEFWEDYLQDAPLNVDSVWRYEEVYETYDDVGIALENKHASQGRFYRKSEYGLKKSYRFACIVDLKKELEYSGDTLQLGAERGLFNVRIRFVEETPYRNHPVIKAFCKPPQADAKKWVALSEAHIDTREEKFAFAFVPRFKEEKTIVRNVKTRRFEKKSEAIRLAPRGSVFYLREAGLMPRTRTMYARAGYNFFIPVTTQGENDV